MKSTFDFFLLAGPPFFLDPDLKWSVNYADELINRYHQFTHFSLSILIFLWCLSIDLSRGGFCIYRVVVEKRFSFWQSELIQNITLNQAQLSFSTIICCK